MATWSLRVAFSNGSIERQIRFFTGSLDKPATSSSSPSFHIAGRFVIRLPESAADAIRRHGRESYRDEACGAIYGRLDGDRREVVRVAPLDNARDSERHRRFVVTTEAYRRAEAEAARNGLTLLGFYHSHPDDPAYPSVYDLEHAFPFFSYVILSVDNAEPKNMRSFILADDRNEFLEESLEEESSPCP